jgi:hypothetical protein
MTPDNEWVRSVRREIWFRLRTKTMRWPLAGERRCEFDEQIAAAFDDRARLMVRNVEDIGPTECVGG